MAAMVSRMRCLAKPVWTSPVWSRGSRVTMASPWSAEEARSQAPVSPRKSSSIASRAPVRVALTLSKADRRASRGMVRVALCFVGMTWR